MAPRIRSRHHLLVDRSRFLASGGALRCFPACIDLHIPRQASCRLVFWCARSSCHSDRRAEYFAGPSGTQLAYLCCTSSFRYTSVQVPNRRCSPGTGLNGLLSKPRSFSRHLQKGISKVYMLFSAQCCGSRMHNQTWRPETPLSAGKEWPTMLAGVGGSHVAARQ